MIGGVGVVAPCAQGDGGVVEGEEAFERLHGVRGDRARSIGKEGVSRVDGARSVFAYASGYVQTNVMQELKRLFLYDNVFICEIAGREEFYSVYQTAGPDDLFVFISLSGESERVKEFSEKLNLKGVPLLAITQMQHNTLASRSTENLYVVPAAFNLPKSEERLPFKSMLAYFLLLEIFYVHYRLYRSEQENSLTEA